LKEDPWDSNKEENGEDEERSKEGPERVKKM